jgi:hypothetical protein
VPISDALVSCRNYQGTFAVHFRYGQSFRFGLPWTPQRQPPLQTDILRVAGTVLMADRAFRRHRRLGGWVRTFKAEIKLAEPDRWSQASNALARVTSFLTDDNWTFEFAPLDSKRRLSTPVRPRVFRSDSGISFGPVVLFSGGLDSFCGACRLMASQNKSGQVPIFVSSFVTGRNRLADLLTELAHIANNAKFTHLPIHGVVTSAKVKGLSTVELPERSRRSRSLYFVLQALAAAIEFSVREIHLYENGIMALNLPLRADESGSRATRHAHPYYLQLVNAFLRALTGGGDIAVLNPFASFTKGEILCYARGSESSIAKTITCWGYPNETVVSRAKHPYVTHCGHCLPCLVRRLALWSANIKDEPRIYRNSGLSAAARRGFMVGDPDIWLEARKLIGFAKEIRSWKPEDLIWKFGGDFLHLGQGITMKDVQTVLDLYRRFSAEIDRVLPTK